MPPLVAPDTLSLAEHSDQQQQRQEILGHASPAQQFYRRLIEGPTPA
jgi:hypothetical protein